MKKLLLVCLFSLITVASFAQETPSSPQTPPATGTSAERQHKYDEFLKANATIGPASISIGEQAKLNLPQGYAFVNAKTAAHIMEGMGNGTDDKLMGLIVSAKPETWFMTVDYNPTGYIKDTDAKNWDTDKMLDEIRDNTDKANQQRASHNMPQLDILGWVEKPRYDADTHRLIWSISARDKGVADDAKSIINYKTMMLGREGYIDMVMVTNLRDVEALKPVANTMLSNLEFTEGKRYANFDAKTDRVAEFGLGALIVGLAAKKLGLIAIIIAFAAKFAKVIAITCLAFFATMRKKLGLKKKQTIIPPPPAQHRDPQP